MNLRPSSETLRSASSALRSVFPDLTVVSVIVPYRTVRMETSEGFNKNLALLGTSQGSYSNKRLEWEKSIIHLVKDAEEDGTRRGMRIEDGDGDEGEDLSSEDGGNVSNNPNTNGSNSKKHPGGEAGGAEENGEDDDEGEAV
ncbi:hypothetical protein HAX54_041535 [Datura stramonium]|uniref:Uncharacterized protein n=1 Tax=Datura stramonium TaxID=4076 RepID=A0ABS8RJD8_DATST|nr:hypothetical protein [Datura stramonium]